MDPCVHATPIMGLHGPLARFFCDVFLVKYMSLIGYYTRKTLVSMLCFCKNVYDFELP